ncbi:MAG: Rieske (2Fe-2S) protein, partial [bacterium]
FGLGAAAVACTYCLGGCNPNNGVTDAPTNVDFTLDLTNPSYAALNGNGGYVYNGGLIVARIADGSYVALSQRCTHAGGTVQYNLNSNIFHCPVHGASFSTSGSVVAGPAGSPLQKYNTTLAGNSLRVYS